MTILLVIKTMVAQNKSTKVWSTITMIVVVMTQEVVGSTTLSWR